ncbi:hypothetical protein [Moorena sp. SIOASIH]|uniref:hypothetical protein n=1 Tax=Moorena sp. SIOASIH TaxID=2607817 RepID=UPI0025FBED6A|nr:hypothetical protein [Moorena sp. SIOASIH]
MVDAIAYSAAELIGNFYPQLSNLNFPSGIEMQITKYQSQQDFGTLIKTYEQIIYK